MSADLVWALVKNNNAFLVKRSNGQFSSEPGNLTNLNSFKYSGLANAKTVDIAPAARGVRVTTLKVKKANSPALSKNTTVIAKSRRVTAKSIANLVVRSGYRADLRKVHVVIIISSRRGRRRE
ncbi:ribosomal L28e/Mak16 [Dichotomocladium elegans]|nr:ribosomal L28e/Mak16 [Dichotomocladium elegans]